MSGVWRSRFLPVHSLGDSPRPPKDAAAVSQPPERQGRGFRARIQWWLWPQRAVGVFGRHFHRQKQDLSFDTRSIGPPEASTVEKRTLYLFKNWALKCLQSSSSLTISVIDIQDVLAIHEKCYFNGKLTNHHKWQLKLKAFTLVFDLQYSV